MVLPSISEKLFWVNKPQRYACDGNELSITAGQKTDMFIDPSTACNTDSAPKLLFKPAGDFVLSAAIEHPFKNKWDGGAIVLITDSLNWIKFCFEKDYTGAKRVVSVVTKGVSDDCNSVSIETDRVFFKLAKASDSVALYYSMEGSAWFLVRHFQFDAKPGFAVGFMAQSPAGPGCTVKFSHIHYSPRRIADPYRGE